LTDAVPYREPKIEKIFYSISEVAGMLGVNPSLIRFWDKEFSMLKLQKNKKGNRLFTQDDIRQLKLIYHLVKEKGMTLKGAAQLLDKNREGTVKTTEVVERLLAIRQQLADIRNEMAENETENHTE
jgi:DNA-binding transcriptional MerR regulator